ncbi:MAG: glycosyltransferase, partial [Hymenobacter sp.]
MQEFPSVSVVIPSWNQGRFISRTLDSILKQDYPGPIEIIVSDGGSNDETVEVLKSYGDRLIWWSAR